MNHLRRDIHKLYYKNPFNGIHPNGQKKWTHPKASIPVAGVYVIKEDGAIVYIGQSQTAIYKTAYRHFQQWNCIKQYRVTYFNRLEDFNYTLGIYVCPPDKAAELEQKWIMKYAPRDNRQWTEYNSLVKNKFTKKVQHSTEGVPF